MSISILIEYDDDYNVSNSLYAGLDNTFNISSGTILFKKSDMIDMKNQKHVNLFLSHADGTMYYKILSKLDFDDILNNEGHNYKSININTYSTFNFNNSLSSSSNISSSGISSKFIIKLENIPRIFKYVIPNKDTVIEDKTTIILVLKSKKILPSIGTEKPQNEYTVTANESIVTIGQRIPFFNKIRKVKGGILHLHDSNNKGYLYNYSGISYIDPTSNKHNTIVYVGKLTDGPAPAIGPAAPAIGPAIVPTIGGGYIEIKDEMDEIYEMDGGLRIPKISLPKFSSTKVDKYILYLKTSVYDIKMKTINNNLISRYYIGKYPTRNFPFISYITVKDNLVYGKEPFYYLSTKFKHDEPDSGKIFNIIENKYLIKKTDMKNYYYDDGTTINILFNANFDDHTSYEIVNNYIEKDIISTSTSTSTPPDPGNIFKENKYYIYHSYGGKDLQITVPSQSKLIQITDLSYDNMYDIFILNNNVNSIGNYLNYQYNDYNFYLSVLTKEQFIKRINDADKKTYFKGGNNISMKIKNKNISQNKTKRDYSDIL